jgi:uncharacterized protein (DUF433 family)
MEFFGLGLYTPSQAAIFTGSDPREVRRWLFGYKSNGGKFLPPLWSPKFASTDEQVIGFSDLMELRVVREFVKFGVPLRIIRTAIANARDVLKTAYPLTTFRFLTDGKSIFHEALDNAKDLTDLAKRQLVFEHIIRPNLYAGIEFNDLGMARRWYPVKSKAVVLDPEISFGRPSLSRFGIPTEVIAQAFKVEGSKKSVAAQFDISVVDVSEAVKYEAHF